MLKPFIALFRIILFLILSLFVSITIPATRVFSYTKSRRIVQFWHQGCLKIFNIKVTTNGAPVADAPCLFVSNHVSYIDIFAIGSRIYGSFVAKKEVRSWPLFGWLSTLQDTIFVDRSSRDIKGQVDAICEPLNKNLNVFLFPEGTSTDGKSVIRFKSSLFALLDYVEQLHIQPIALRFYAPDGTPLTDEHRDCYAYYGDMIFGTHLLKMLSGKGVHIEVNFHQSFDVKDYSGDSQRRKHIANHCYELIKHTVDNADTAFNANLHPQPSSSQ